MRSTLLLTAIFAPLAALAAPGSYENKGAISARQAAPVKPTPCVRIVPEPCEEDTKARFEAFADAFIGPNKDISEAFSYIVQDYINHNPIAEDGFDAAWDVLSPIWPTVEITPIRQTFISPQGWVNYNTSFGTVVDRFRWEGGCIAEHWDEGEVYPEEA
ncbi:hypothetical protein HYFRA_00001373 [Hymenoscyphus fraxineus]|uniref:SnoaL-like domain-containing protein n=1 Tax=Hymenoscyphus fraxineus TaxID=746836 RepID=A0A9N9L859_9HELO|nr:hypothetical protein HYFRA_00001373 [Hymenoscyphus fraxineus]